MPTELRLPALSPTMEHATLLRWEAFGRLKVTPLARRLAASSGINLAQIQGSGPGGRIVKADVAHSAPRVTASQQAARPDPALSIPAAQVPVPGDIPAETVKLSIVRRTIARRLSESKRQIPHIYLTIDVCLDRLLALRALLNHSLQSRGVKVSVNDMLIKALAASLAEVPDCNVAFAGDALIKYERVDISVAMALADGLITPIVKDAGGKSVAAIASEMRDFAARARDGSLCPDESIGGTASLSNLSMFGIQQFSAILDPPQATILAVGAGEKRPHVVDDALEIATMMSVTGSFDHRAIDGAIAAQLMAAFRDYAEHPLGILA